MITNVYVDGFNLYYRALKDTPFRWLDLRKLAATLFPDDTIRGVHYFTARLDARRGNPGQAQRQLIYIRGLSTLRGEQLGPTEDELAFYDALETNDSAVQVLGDEALRAIARELVETVRRNVTIDWTLRENVRANLRRLVRRILRRHGYPPDKQEQATLTVLEQAEVLSEGWVAA